MEKDDIKSIIRTFCAAFAYCLTFVALVINALFFAFPSAAVDFYDNAGYGERSYAYVKLLAANGGESNLYRAASDAIRLGRKVDALRFCKKYLTAVGKDEISERDARNLKASPARAYDVYLYSIENYFAVYCATSGAGIWNGEAFVPSDSVLRDFSSRKEAAIALNQSVAIHGNVDAAAIDYVLSGEEEGLERLFLLKSALAACEYSGYSPDVNGKSIQTAYRDAFDEYCAEQ